METTSFIFARVDDANVFASYVRTAHYADVERVDPDKVRVTCARIDHYYIRRSAEYYDGQIEASTIEGLPQ